MTSAKIASGTITSSNLSSSLITQLTSDTGDLVGNPSSTQTITYGGAAVGTVLKMASGATADPLEIQDSTGSDVFAVGTDGSLTASGALSTDAGALTSDGFGDLTVGGTLSTDNGNITTDGLGNLTVAGSISTDGGNISSDGSGNLTILGDVTDWGGNYLEGADVFGNSLQLDGGGLVIYGTNSDGNYLDIGGGTLTVDGDGNLTVTGNIIDANLPTSDPSVAGEMWQNCSVTDSNGDTINGCFVQIDGP